ncbi:hypothetical protein Leryth_003620 [Lithospermum erythrorhizon]|nr:hypothetical protein Leryth_003620 [Lithospermum erythrorhizon]
MLHKRSTYYLLYISCPSKSIEEKLREENLYLMKERFLIWL